MDSMMSMLITEVVEAGIKSILSLLTPAGAFVKDNTPINALPDFANSYATLKSIYAPNTGIKKIPDAMINCSNLEEINFENCNITKIPSFLFDLKKLKLINLYKNPITKQQIDMKKAKENNIAVVM